MPTFYDANANMQFANPLQALAQGAQLRQQMQNLQRQDEIRNGLMKFYQPAQAARTETGFAASPSINALKNMGSTSLNDVIPSVGSQQIPAKPASFDFSGAADWLASKGALDEAGSLAKLRDLINPQKGKYFGGQPFEARQGDKNVLLAMTEAGPVELPYQPKPEMPKAPTTRHIKKGSREITQEWGANGWQDVADAPRELPKPEKPEDPRKNLDYEIKLGDRYQREVQSFKEVRQARDNVVNSLNQNSAAGDLAAATAIMKMLDPGSVVRESELGMAMNATGVFDRIGNYAQMIKNGQRLNPDQRKEFLGLASTLYATADQYHGQTKQRFNSIAQQYGLDPYNITGEAPNMGMPKIGAIVDGYMFLGGNSKDPARWRKVK